MTDRATCSKCGGTMEAGFMKDQGLGAIPRVRWVKGRPRGFLGRPKGKDTRYVTTLRCTECGFLRPA